MVGNEKNMDIGVIYSLTLLTLAIDRNLSVVSCFRVSSLLG